MQVKKIQKSTRKISQLNHKISEVRKWSFLSFKSSWIDNNVSFQKNEKNRIRFIYNFT